MCCVKRKVGRRAGWQVSWNSVKSDGNLTRTRNFFFAMIEEGQGPGGRRSKVKPTSQSCQRLSDSASLRKTIRQSESGWDGQQSSSTSSKETNQPQFFQLLGRRPEPPLVRNDSGGLGGSTACGCGFTGSVAQPSLTQFRSPSSSSSSTHLSLLDFYCVVLERRDDLG